MIFVYAAAGAVLILASAVLIRTFLFTPPRIKSPEPEKEKFDANESLENLRKLIRFKTVSNPDPALENSAEFDSFRSALPSIYPDVFSVCSVIPVEGRGILLRWNGRSRECPSVMMSHYDVVEADESGWSVPPFSAEIKDGFLYGRGVIDTKLTLNAALSAAQELIRRGFVPEHDIYFAFSGTEEFCGPDASLIVKRLKKDGICPSVVLDEGCGVLHDIYSGIKKTTAVIGISEKGQVNVRYTVRSGGGHASSPLPHTPVGILSKAACRLEKHPFSPRICEPVRMQIDTLGRHADFLHRLIYANLWLFKGLLAGIESKKGGEMNALLRTTVALTMADGSKAPNVIPASAHFISNSRVLPGENVEGTLQHIRKTVRDPRVHVEAEGESFEPCPVSPVDCGEWEKLTRAIAMTWPDSVVSPCLMVPATDIKYYVPLTDRLYRFSPMDLSAAERATIHGNDERMRLEAISKSVEFYIRFLKQL